MSCRFYISSIFVINKRLLVKHTLTSHAISFEVSSRTLHANISLAKQGITSFPFDLLFLFLKSKQGYFYSILASNSC